MPDQLNSILQIAETKQIASLFIPSSDILDTPNAWAMTYCMNQRTDRIHDNANYM
jgi:hypothetical protein